MPYCADCGAEVATEDKFCPKCGHPNETPASPDPLPLRSSQTGSATGGGSFPPVTAPAPQASTMAVPQPAAASAPSKKLSGCAIAAIIGGGVLVLLGVLVAGVIFLAFALSSGAVDAMKDHLALLKQGQVERAYEGTSSEFRSVTSLEDYRAFVAAYPALSSVESSSFAERSVENDVATLGGTIVDPAGRKSTIRARLIKEGDDWKVMAVEVSDGEGEDGGGVTGGAEGAAVWSPQGRVVSSVESIAIGAGRDAGGTLRQSGQALPLGVSELSADFELRNYVPGERVEIWVEQGGDRTAPFDLVVDRVGSGPLAFDMPIGKGALPSGDYTFVVRLGESRRFTRNFEIR